MFAAYIVTGVALVAGPWIVLMYPGGAANAAGIPGSDPLHYTGVLGDTAGGLISGTRVVGLDLWTAKTGGTKACSTQAKQLTITSGRFHIVLDASCLKAVQQNPDLWVEVLVGGASMGRQKIGAVPFAVEAKSAASTGAIKDCPAGYTRDKTATGFILCKKGKDELVKVGDSWVDRYESSIVDASTFNGGKCDGSGKQFGVGTTDDFPTTFPDIAQATTPLYACSRAGSTPSRL